MSKKNEKESYSASNLQVLEGLDAVRKRPGMYIGSTDSRGLQHCLWEIIDNSVDEALAGFCSEIAVTLHKDGSFEVEDNGRGIPTDIEPKTGLSGVEVVFTKLHAGGKFGGGSYAASGGLHGVGASVVNALSSRVSVEVIRDGKVYALDFKRGVAGHFDDKGQFKEGVIKVIGENKSEKTSGTKVRYWPDKSIFLANAEVDLELTYTRARQTAFLVTNLSITVSDLRDSKATTQRFSSEGGLGDFVEFLSKGNPVGEKILINGEGDFVESVPVLNNDGTMSVQDVTRSCKVEIGMLWNSTFDPSIHSFVNIIATPKGGTHVTGFERGLTKTFNEVLRNLKLLKSNDENLIKEDILEGLTAVVLVRLAEPQFEGQTKEILGTSAVNQIVSSLVSEKILDFFSDNKKKTHARSIAEKILNAQKARISARNHRETVRRKNALESSSLPAKLSDCRSNDFEKSELFIIEGDSAGGTVKAARDAEFQALMPIRGKILNTMRASEKQMLENAECAAIIAAMGAGSGKSFNIDNIRYGKFIVLADADVDGAHIRCLLLTLCYKYMRPLLEEGRVYAAVPPLYRITPVGSSEHIYCYSDIEKDEAVAKIAKAGRKLRDDSIQRYKGLGEMDANQLAETTMDKAQRKLRRMTVADGAYAEETFNMLMGNDVAGRKDFIVANGGLLDPERIDA